MTLTFTVPASLSATRRHLGHIESGRGIVRLTLLNSRFLATACHPPHARGRAPSATARTWCPAPRKPGQLLTGSATIWL